MIKNQRLPLYAVLIIFISSFLTACHSLPHVVTLSEKNWKNYYQEIQHSPSDKFIQGALNEAIALYGKPSFEINKIHLVRSKKKPEFNHLLIQEDFSLTEVINSTNGIVVIYIGVNIDNENYYPLLAHEVFHLLNPYIKDWYMEGLASSFAEEYCLKCNLLSDGWIERFTNKKNDPYVTSFNMMNDIKSIFPNSHQNILQFTTKDIKNKNWIKIDINEWLNTYSYKDRTVLVDIIKIYEKRLKRKSEVAFTLPKEYSKDDFNKNIWSKE